MDDPLAEVLLCEMIEPSDGGEILREAWLLEFWVGAAQIVAIEFGIRPHSTGEKTAAKRTIAEGRDPVLAAVGQDIGFDAALEQIVGRLQHMERRNATEPLHLVDRKVAYTDRA